MLQTGHRRANLTPPPSVNAPPQMAMLPREVYARAFTLPAQSRVALHRHPWAQLLYAATGILEVQTEAGAFLLPPQYAVWIPPGYAHGVTTTQPVALQSVYLDGAMTADVHAPAAVLAMTPLLRELLKTAPLLPVTYEREGPHGRLMQVLIDCVRSLQAAPLALPLPSDRRLRQIAMALQADPADARGLEDWAAQLGRSRRTLARQFQAQTRLSFTAWRQRLRLLFAVPRLQAGCSVTQVAAELGYASTSAFIACFQRCYGLTPGALSRAA